MLIPVEDGPAVVACNTCRLSKDAREDETDHRGGDAGGKRADPVDDKAMVARKNRGARVDERGPGIALPPGQKQRHVFQSAQRSRRFGQLILPRTRRRNRVGVGFGQIGQRRFKRGARHKRAHSATNPAGGVRVMKWPLTPCGHCLNGTRPCSLSA